MLPPPFGEHQANTEGFLRHEPSFLQAGLSAPLVQPLMASSQGRWCLPCHCAIRELFLDNLLGRCLPRLFSWHTCPGPCYADTMEGKRERGNETQPHLPLGPPPKLCRSEQISSETTQSDWPVCLSLTRHKPRPAYRIQPIFPAHDTCRLSVLHNAGNRPPNKPLTARCFRASLHRCRLPPPLSSILFPLHIFFSFYVQGCYSCRWWWPRPASSHQPASPI